MTYFISNISLVKSVQGISIVIRNILTQLLRNTYSDSGKE